MDITLALGGGGSKGNAHIGVLRVLEREGFRIRAVAGTSAGGMAASAYAAGYSPDELEKVMCEVDQRSLFGFHFGDEPSLLGVDGITQVMQNLLDDRTFVDLKIPCALVAVDLQSGKKVVLQEGKVLDAVMATIAIPGIFPPKKWGDYLLVDGGVLDPVPISVVREISPLHNLPVIAVTLTSVPTHHGLMPHIGPKAVEPILSRISRLRLSKAFEIFLHSIDIGVSSITEMRLQLDAPDVLIRPDVCNIGYLDHVEVCDVVRIGEVAAEAALPEIRKAVSFRSRLGRWIKSR